MAAWYVDAFSINKTYRRPQTKQKQTLMHTYTYGHTIMNTQIVMHTHTLKPTQTLIHIRAGNVPDAPGVRPVTGHEGTGEKGGDRFIKQEVILGKGGGRDG